MATGTTFVANFDRLGVQVIMVGANVDQGTTLKSIEASAAKAGQIILGSGDNAATVNVAAGETLASIATNLDTALKTLSPPGSAVFDANLGEIQIETAGNAYGELATDSTTNSILGAVNANAYVDGRLEGRSFFVEAGTGGVLQVGANDNANNRIALNIGDMRASGATLNLTGLSVANLESSRGAISTIDEAILNVARQRGDLGAVQNRLQYTTANLGNAIENLQAAESAIRDADVAEEISAFTRGQILTQAATAMVAQANALPQTALQLLQ